MLRVAIVGCGKIADAHASQIGRLKDCELVAVCDREILMAKQLAERFSVNEIFREVPELLEIARPDVVHITTPPDGHFGLAKLCLENNVNVYIEKPFTVYANEAEELVSLAERKGLKLTAGHNYQFSPAARRMRELVQAGYLGGPAVHIESHYSYNLADAAYARALLSDKQHWVRKLPGKLLHNIISHGVARIAEFLTTATPRVMVQGFVSPLLKDMGETEIIDELRVVISEEDRCTAYFTFSSQMRPPIHELRVFGPKNGLILDQDHDILIKLKGNKYKSFADKFLPPLLFAKQHLENFIANAKLFLSNDFHMDAGLKHLIEAFYGSIQKGAPVPIPYGEILVTARIMDAIFDQLPNNRAPHDKTLNPGWEYTQSSSPGKETRCANKTPI